MRVFISEICPHCKQGVCRRATCADCVHSFENPFDQGCCKMGYTGTRLCNEFEPFESMSIIRK